MNVRARRSSGFTIVEMSLVLIVLGILAVALAPMLQVVHDDSMRERDMATLETARKALLGYIRIHEGIPCVDASGTQVASGCDPERTLDLLGVRSTDARRMSFAFDANDTLTVAGIGASGNSLCTALADIIDPPAPPPVLPVPAVCASGNTNTGNSACERSRLSDGGCRQPGVRKPGAAALAHPGRWVLRGPGGDPDPGGTG